MYVYDSFLKRSVEQFSSREEVTQKKYNILHYNTKSYAVEKRASDQRNKIATYHV